MDTEWEAHQAPVFGGDPASRARAEDRRAELFARLKSQGKVINAPEDAFVPVNSPMELARRSGVKRLWIKAPTLARASELLRSWPTPLELELELEDPTEVKAELLDGRKIARVLAHTSAQAQALLAGPGTFEVVLELSRQSAPWLSSLTQAPPRLVVRQPTWDKLTDSQTNDVELGEFFSGLRAPLPAEGVPACITPHARADASTLDTSMMTAEGRLEAFRFTKRYILDHYFTKSLRCAECVHVDSCRGLHVNYVRAHGYAVMKPVPALAEKVG